ncbi:hypothetical protein E2C01_071922 [Portunus trituberculatus]|uniref:Uncharacterized protein n=1 Tax=Portunus trituberculatus TaxID=210409 RepID=A0A5B7I9A4_PORTR|nr:hypothetical protein [Portunus trituberculatus]
MQDQHSRCAAGTQAGRCVLVCQRFYGKTTLLVGPARR